MLQQGSWLDRQWGTGKEQTANKWHLPKFESLAGGLGGAPMPNGLGCSVPNRKQWVPGARESHLRSILSPSHKTKKNSSGPGQT